MSYAAQYRMVFAAKGVAPVAALEAAIPDVAALIFATLGIALALHGRRAIRARVLNVGAVATSVAMNVLAAGHGWRDLAIWAMPPVAYALASDTAIGVVRAWTIARQKALNEALADDEATPLAILGGLLLWLLRLALAPGSTLAGFRAWVLEECPVAPGRRGRPASPGHRAQARAAPGDGDHRRPGEPAGAGERGPGTKTARFLALVAERYGPLDGLPAGRCVAGQRRAGPRGRPRPRRGPDRAAPPRPVAAERERPVTSSTSSCSCPACWCWRVLRWCFGPHSRLPRFRVRYLRLRLHLRLHPGRGHATRVRAVAAVGPAGRVPPLGPIPPVAAGLAAAGLPGRAFGALGRAQYRHRLRVPVEEHMLIMAPPRTGKTGAAGQHHPALSRARCVSTTTKHDVFAADQRDPVPAAARCTCSTRSGSAACRRRSGGTRSTGCADPATAIRRADGFANAVSMTGTEDASFWIAARPPDYLRVPVPRRRAGGRRHAAGRPVGAGQRRARRGHPRPGRRRASGPPELAELRGEAQKTAATIRMVLTRALAFMTDPALARPSLPAGDGAGFDIERVPAPSPGRCT